MPTSPLYKSFYHDPDFDLPPRHHQLVIDRQSQQEGFWRNCQDRDHAVQRVQQVDFTVLQWVDFKVYDQPTDHQMYCLQLFLDNSRPHKMLHVALYHDASSDFLSLITWRARKITLDIHDYFSEHTAQQRLELHVRLPVHRYCYADYYWHDSVFFDLKASKTLDRQCTDKYTATTRT